MWEIGKGGGGGVKGVFRGGKGGRAFTRAFFPMRMKGKEGNGGRWKSERAGKILRPRC
jgi:hypothetical protein